LLTGTGVLEAVQRDISSLTKEFNDIVLPFVRKHKDVFRYTSNLYEKYNIKCLFTFDIGDRKSNFLFLKIKSPDYSVTCMILFFISITFCQFKVNVKYISRPVLCNSDLCVGF